MKTLLIVISYIKLSANYTDQDIKVITTEILDSHTDTIYHRISSLSNKEALNKGVETALTLVQSVITQQGGFNLIIDLRSLPSSPSDYNFNNHQYWSREFKGNKMVISHVQKTAMIGPDNEKYRAEKELLDSDVLRFFFSFDDAVAWVTQAN